MNSKFLGFLLLMSFACHKSEHKEAANSFDDEQLIKIYEYQDQRNSKALIPFLKAKETEHRLAAALAFASIQDSFAIEYLGQMAQSDLKEEARRAAVYALGQIGNRRCCPVLQSALRFETSKTNIRFILESLGKCADSATWNFLKAYTSGDPVIREGWVYGIFRAMLRGYADESALQRIYEFLENHPDHPSGIIGAHYVYRYHKKFGLQDRQVIKNLIALQTQDEVMDRLGLLLLDSPQLLDFSAEFQEKYGQANGYEKAKLLGMLKMDWDRAHPLFVEEFRNESNQLILREAAFERISGFCTENRSHPSCYDHIMYAFQTGDMALISLAANAVLELPQLEMEVYKKHLKFFDSLLYSLHLPRQIETYNDLQRLISSIESEPFEKRKLDFNHPIDWAFVKTVPQDLKVRIETSKGAIIIGCKVNEAPGSVANFLKLVDSGYYDQKYFHRVVPDFVIQGGCPRGDGWGSLNWSQRSEFSNFLHYGAGAVGLANAGRDTEGVQFFITHCSTPHLDGRYTIFAYVLEGMDVVRRIEVGDQIISISRINVNA